MIIEKFYCQIYTGRLSTLYIKVSSYLQMLNEHLKKGKHWGDTGMRSSNFITLNDT